MSELIDKVPSRTRLKFTKEKLPLSKLIFPTKLQPREEINKEAVEDYTTVAKAANAKGADSPFPPFKAVKRNGEIIVFSGFTRHAALKKAGYDATMVEVAASDEITDAELFRLAIEANQEQGARLTNADKLHNFERALKWPEYKNLSNRALAEVIGVSESFIRTNRPASETPAKRTDKVGREFGPRGTGKKAQKKKAKAAAKKADGNGSNIGTVDEPNLDTPPVVETDKDPEIEKAVNKIAKTLDGYSGYTASGIKQAIADGAVKVSNLDLRLWAAQSESDIRRIAPLITTNSWSARKALSHIKEEITPKTKVEHLINSAISGGGVLRRNSINVGVPIKGNDEFHVVVWDTRKFEVTFKEIKG